MQSLHCILLEAALLGSSLAFSNATSSPQSTGKWFPRNGYTKYTGSDGDYRTTVVTLWSPTDLNTLKSSGSPFFEVDFAMPNGSSESKIQVFILQGSA